MTAETFVVILERHRLASRALVVQVNVGALLTKVASVTELKQEVVTSSFIHRSCRPMPPATGKVPSMTAAMLPQTTRCCRGQAKEAWPYRKVRPLESLTWDPPSSCCSRLPKTLCSSCSQVSESEWAKASAPTED